MNWRSTWILLSAALVLFAFVWLVERPIRRERLLRSNHLILPGFNPASVNTINVRPRGGAEIQVARVAGSNAVWRLTQPLSYPAETGPISTVLGTLAGLTWQDRLAAAELTNKPDGQAEYGFSQPLFELTLQSSAGSQRILVGQPSFGGDQVFLEVIGDPDIYLVDSELLKLLPPDKDQWRDASLINPARLIFDSIQARSPGRGVIELRRDPTNHLWSMTKPVTARADNAKINDWLGRIGRLSVQAFATDDPKADLELYGLQTSPQTPELDLSFWRGSNQVAGLQVSPSPTNQPNYSYARRLDPSNIVVIERESLRPWQSAYTNFLDYHILSQSPSNIGTISVQGESRFTVQKQSDGRWLVHAEATFPADAGLMKDWLAAFANIQTQTEKTVATDLAAYGLNHPLLAYTLLPDSVPAGATNPILAQIEFGSDKTGRNFERRVDELSVNIVNYNDFSRLPVAAWQLRDRTIWSFDSNDVVSVTVHQLGATRKLVRDPAGDWTFAPGTRGPIMTWSALREGMDRISHLSADYWSGVGDARWREFGFPKADFQLDLEVKKDGRIETNSIAFGGRSPYSYPYASVTRDGQRLIFEFPVELYDNFVAQDMAIYPDPVVRQTH